MRIGADLSLATPARCTGLDEFRHALFIENGAAPPGRTLVANSAKQWNALSNEERRARKSKDCHFGCAFRQSPSRERGSERVRGSGSGIRIEQWVRAMLPRLLCLCFLLFLSVLLCSKLKKTPPCEVHVLGVTKNKSKMHELFPFTKTFLVAFGTQGLCAWYDDPTHELVPARA